MLVRIDHPWQQELAGEVDLLRAFDLRCGEGSIRDHRNDALAVRDYGDVSLRSTAGAVDQRCVAVNRSVAPCRQLERGGSDEEDGSEDREQAREHRPFLPVRKKD
jgi:hypothetical protein